MDVSYTRRFPHSGEELTARIMKTPDGNHVAEIVSTVRDGEETVLWSRDFRTNSVMTITGRVVAQFDHFVACRLPQA